VQPWTLLNTFHWSFAGSSATVDTLKHFHWSFGHYKPHYEALHFTTRTAPSPSWPAWLLALVLVLHPSARSPPCTLVHSRGNAKNYRCLDRQSTYGSVGIYINTGLHVSTLVKSSSGPLRHRSKNQRLSSAFWDPQHIQLRLSTTEMIVMYTFSLYTRYM